MYKLNKGFLVCIRHGRSNWVAEIWNGENRTNIVAVKSKAQCINAHPVDRIRRNFNYLDTQLLKQLQKLK